MSFVPNSLRKQSRNPPSERHSRKWWRKQKIRCESKSDTKNGGKSD